MMDSDIVAGRSHSSAGMDPMGLKTEMGPHNGMQNTAHRVMGNCISLAHRQGMRMYFVRHAERLDALYPTWHTALQLDPLRWPPGLLEALPVGGAELEGLRFAHAADPPITAHGRTQARQTAETLINAGIAHIYSSPMLRCMQTAREFAEVLGIPVRVEPGAMEILDERWYPVPPTPLMWHGSRAAAQLGIPIDTSYKSPVPFPARHEHFSDWTERSSLMLKNLTKDDTLDSGSVLIVTHGFSAACLSWMLETEHPPLLGYCALTTFERDAMSVTSITTTRHLEQKLPTSATLTPDGAANNVLVWLASASGVELDRSNRVSCWHDASESLPGRTDNRAGRHATQIRSGLRPFYTRSLLLRRIPVVSFENSLQHTSSASPVTGLDQHIVAPVTGSYRSFTLALLFKVNTLTDVHSIITVDPTLETNGLNVRIDKQGNLGVFAGNIAAVVARGAITPDRWTLLVLRIRNGKEVRLWIDFTRCVVGGSLRGLCPAFGPWEGLYIGKSTANSRGFHGEVAELVAFASALEDPVINELHTYFIRKFV